MILRGIFISFLLSLIVSSSSFAQSKKANEYFTVQGGILLAFYPNANYLGLNFGKIGWSKAQNGREFGFELEGFYFKIRSENFKIVSFPSNNIREIVRGFDRQKYRIQASYYLGRRFVETKKMNWLIAPVTSLGVDRNRITPLVTFSYPESITKIFSLPPNYSC